MCQLCDTLPLATAAAPTLTLASIFVCGKFIAKPKPKPEPRFWWCIHTLSGSKLPCERIPAFDSQERGKAFMDMRGNLVYSDYDAHFLTFEPLPGSPTLS